ncbi:Flocculation suppression protein [Umbelopsis nana]
MQGENGDQQRDDHSIPPMRSWASHTVPHHEGAPEILHSPDVASSHSGTSTPIRRRELTTRESSESITYIIPGTQSAFVTKLYNIVGDEDIQHLISWSKDGDVFSVKNPTEFARTILPQYFKHNNWQSFVRQLNMYGFHKVNDVFHTLTNEQQLWEFAHECFRRGQPELLQKIKRKTGARLSPAQIIKSDSPGDTADLTEERIRHLEQQIIHLQSKCDTIMKINSDLKQAQLQQQEIIDQLNARIRDDSNGDSKYKRKISDIDRLTDRGRSSDSFSPRSSIGTTSQPHTAYQYDQDDAARKSSLSANARLEAQKSGSNDRSPRTIGPSLLRNSRSEYSSSSMHPLHNPYSTYTSEYPGGEIPSSSSDRSIDNVERYTVLPPILGPDQKSTRSADRRSYQSSPQNRPPPHEAETSSSSNRAQEGQIHQGMWNGT